MKVIELVGKRRKVYGLAVVGVLVVALVLSVWASGAFASERYRLGTAALGTVSASLATSGTIDASERRDVAAATAGTVSKVLVSTGDTVKAGDPLVRLSSSSAKKSLRAAEARLATAKATLASTRSAQTSAASTASASKTSASTKTQSSAKASGTKQTAKPEITVPTLDDLTAAQDAVIAAQSAATTALADAKQALADRNDACAPVDDEDDSGSDGCAEALTAVSEAQDAAATAQDALQEAIETLTATLADILKQTQEAVDIMNLWLAQQSNDGQPQPVQPAQPDANSVKKSTGAQVAASSALSLAQAQADVDEAQVAVTSAQRDVDATKINAPISGTVTNVAVRAGGSVSAGDVVVTVIGSGGATVELSLSGTTVTQVKTGHEAEVQLPGASNVVRGKVTWVSPVASSGGNSPFASTTTWQATVFISAEDLADGVLPQGARVDVTVDLGTTGEVLTVPTSALVMGDATTVRVLDGNAATSRTVEVGVIGAERSEIVSGLDAGDSVVLADLSAEIDAAGEINTSRQGAGPGGMPGGGFPGGTMPGGGPPNRGSR